MFVILNVYDAKNSNIGSVAICRHLTIWLALGIPKRIICYHCSNWTNRRNDLTGPEDPILYSDRVIWLCVLLLLMVKGFDYWIGTKNPQIALDYLTMLNTGQQSLYFHRCWVALELYFCSIPKKRDILGMVGSTLTHNFRHVAARSLPAAWKHPSLKRTRTTGPVDPRFACNA